MTDIQNPTDLSDYDWLEFGAFCLKVDTEGYAYAADEYSPDFENPVMQTIAEDFGRLRAFYLDNYPKYETWAEHTVGWESAIGLHNAHVDGARQRERDACLWGIRCADGYVIHSRSREDQAWSLDDMQSGRPGRRVPAALLHREVPGGEWTESPLAAAKS